MRNFKLNIRKPLANNRIRARRVRLIDETGKQLGIMDLEKALQEAKERNLDLVQVTEKVEPPVCKITDYGKYLYSQERKKRQVKTQKGSELKGIRIGFNTSSHDLETKARQAEKFLKRGDRVRIEMLLRGRQKALSEFAKRKIDQFLEIVQKEISIKTERELKKRGNRLTIIIIKE